MDYIFIKTHCNFPRNDSRFDIIYQFTVEKKNKHSSDQLKQIAYQSNIQRSRNREERVVSLTGSEQSPHHCHFHRLALSNKSSFTNRCHYHFGSRH